VDQLLVMHLDEIEGRPQDATAYKNNASEFKGGQGLPSIIGTGVTLTSIDDVISINNSPSMDFSAGFTFSAWVRITEGITEANLFSMSGDNGEIKIGIENSMIYCSVKSDTENIISTEKTTGLAPMTWQHLCVTIVPDGRISIFLDGIESTWADMKFSMPQLGSGMFIGNSTDRTKPFLGDLDEIRIAKSIRSQSYIRLSHMAEGPESLFLVVEGEEINEGGGMPVFYLATIVKEISLDGWAIIILLILFALASWFIIISKSVQLVFIEKENKLFMDSFLNNSDMLENDKQDDAFENSPICRLHQSGCNSLKNLLEKLSGEKKSLTRRDVNTVRTFLDEGYVREDQKLNSLVVVLTMAISGGPFLGLLGTVWGVMNTFAAMAEAGEANIMAIAPGVASALSTTVFGLIVAIPALFGYNYIASKIKGVTAEMDIFIEKFILKMEEKYGDVK
ncbi:MAG: MotA/TolQ/ExbB proton channel family protein, partial [Desulfobacteraceae bacterium]